MAQIVSNVDAALLYLTQKTPDLAVVDFHVGGGTSERVAQQLRGANVPFIVCSGSDIASLPEVFGASPFLAKPYSAEDVAGALQLLELGS